MAHRWKRYRLDGKNLTPQQWAKEPGVRVSHQTLRNRLATLGTHPTKDEIRISIYAPAMPAHWRGTLARAGLDWADIARSFHLDAAGNLRSNEDANG